jgi:Flp pilus assembly pilin Flp
MYGHRNARWRTTAADARGERGVAMAEYLPLLAVIAVVVMFALPALGGWVNDQLGIGGLSIHYGDYVAGECPSGGDWVLTNVEDAPVKNGPDPNQNGDNYVCVKSGMGNGNGNGNSGQNANNKDNNTDPVDNGG